MCQLPMPTYGYRRVARKRVRLERLNRFAADSLLNDETLGAAKFWRRVLGVTVAQEETWETDPAYGPSGFGRE